MPPFQYQQLEQPGIHTVLNSFDVMGGSHTFTAVWTSAKFRDKNPVLYKAFIAALQGSDRHRQQGQARRRALWIEDSKSKLPLDMVTKIVAGPQVHWTMMPENTMKFADFMAERRHAEGEGGVLEGLFLPGDLRPEGKLREERP